MDITSICRDIGARLIVIPRPSSSFDLKYLSSLGIDIADSLSFIKQYIDKGYQIVVLETYGSISIDLFKPSSDRIVVVLGAEDYGLPKDEISKLGPADIVRIDMAIDGFSLNVVSALVIFLTKLLLNP